MMLVSLWCLLMGEAPAPLSDEALQATLTLQCRACHSMHYVEQQRLTATQWTGTLKKMRHFGAVLEEAAVPALAEALAARFGPTGRPYTPLPKKVELFRPPADLKSGRAHKQGKALFAQRCLACHGPKAEGGVGVNLADRQLLQQPEAFREVVKKGRGTMPPHPDLTVEQMDSLLAFLNTL